MTRLLPILHDGHAPIGLHFAFEEALEAFEAWEPGMPEPAVPFEGRQVRVSAIFGRMRRCSDLLPQRVLDHVCEVVGNRSAAFEADSATYAEAAFLLRALCVEHLRTREA